MANNLAGRTDLMEKQIGWKKVAIYKTKDQFVDYGFQQDAILKLEILGDVRHGPEMYNGGMRKSRTSRVRVLAVYALKTTRKIKKYFRIESFHDGNYTYKVGAIKKPKLPFSKGRQECASGIHFFEVRSWAEQW